MFGHYETNETNPKVNEVEEELKEKPTKSVKVSKKSH